MSVSPPPHDELEAPSDHLPEPALECPRCGTPYEPDQEYCLECGLRLPEPPVGVVASLGGAWQRRLGWYPGDWVWVALLAFVVALLCAIGAIVFVSQDTKSSAKTVAHTSPTKHMTTTLPTAPERPTTSSRTTTRRTTTGGKAKPKPQPPSSALTSWPAGRTGWTVVLVSTLSSGSAADQAHRALRSGLTNVGVLDSSHYSSLHPGYFVVFSGIYDSEAETHSALATARANGYLSAYSRRITP